MKVVIQFCEEVFAVQTIIAMTTAASTTVEQGVLSSTTSSSSSRSSFSRRSATYTASTFTAFEYESSYEYHGMYNIETTAASSDQTAASSTNYVKSDLEKNQSSLMPSMSSRQSSEQTSTKLFDDFDDLLQTLTADEVAELSVVDPDVRMLQLNNMCTYLVFFYCTVSLDASRRPAASMY